MIEPGHPFSQPFASLIASLEDSILSGVEQPASTEFIFKKDVKLYEIRGNVSGISRVTGLRNKVFTVFEQVVHYRYAAGRLIWNPAPPSAPGETLLWYPDENSRIDVEYTYRDIPSGLTDFNSGSVIAILVRAVAREFKILYEQMDQAYRRAFIDIAAGVALDNVVALLNVIRNPALKATGFVTFFLKEPTKKTIPVLSGTRVADDKGKIFITTAGGTIEPEKTESLYHNDGVITTGERIAEIINVRVRGTSTDLDLIPGPASKPFGDNEKTVRLAAGVGPAGELEVSYKPKSITLTVEAFEVGPEGNVGAAQIKVMPTPPRGINGGVINELPLSGGKAAESDEQLRERAKHALETAGHATLTALKFAILDVEGVEEVEVVDHTIDETIPVGEVRIRYSGGDESRVLAAIEETRAAGIVVRATAVSTVLLSGSFFAIPDTNFTESSANQFKNLIIDALNGSPIGGGISLRKLSSLVYQASGLADVAEAQLNYSKIRPGDTGPFATGVVVDPFLLDGSELARPDISNITIAVIGHIGAAANRQTNQTTVTVQFMHAQGGGAVRFNYFSIDLVVTVKAKLKEAPTQAPYRLCSVTKKVTFTNTDSASFTVLDEEIKDLPGHPGFRPADHAPHAEFHITAAAYQGLTSGMTVVDLSSLT